MTTNVSTTLSDLGTGVGNFFNSAGAPIGGFIAVIGIVMAIVGLIGGITYMISHNLKG